MIDDYTVTWFHFFEKLDCGGVGDAIPGSGTVLGELVDGVGFGIGFGEEVVHRYKNNYILCG